MGWKCEMGWEERIMLGTGILAFPSLASPAIIETPYGPFL
jgi:hypothetical protein